MTTVFSALGPGAGAPASVRAVGGGGVLFQTSRRRKEIAVSNQIIATHTAVHTR
jgi:hypothetical protein